MAKQSRQTPLRPERWSNTELILSCWKMPKTLRIPASIGKTESGKSIKRYFPPNGKLVTERWFVRVDIFLWKPTVFPKLLSIYQSSSFGTPLSLYPTTYTSSVPSPCTIRDADRTFADNGPLDLSVLANNSSTHDDRVFNDCGLLTWAPVERIECLLYCQLETVIKSIKVTYIWEFSLMKFGGEIKLRE